MQRREGALRSSSRPELSPNRGQRARTPTRYGVLRPTGFAGRCSSAKAVLGRGYSYAVLEVIPGLGSTQV